MNPRNDIKLNNSNANVEVHRKIQLYFFLDSISPKLTRDNFLPFDPYFPRSDFLDTVVLSKSPLETRWGASMSLFTAPTWEARL